MSETFNRPHDNEPIAFAIGEYVDRGDIEAEARMLIENKEAFAAAEIPNQEFQDNARTALMEALTASGHLSRIEIRGSLDEINQQILTRLINGYDERLPAHEKNRRFQELCNELTIQKIHYLMRDRVLPSDLSVLEISDYPSVLSEGEAMKLGYRSENKKGMVRSTHLQREPDGSFVRIIEQVSRSNSDPEATLSFFADQDIYPYLDDESDIVALKNPVLYQTSTLKDGVVDVQRRLDAIAGSRIRYGEEIHELQIPYDKLREESTARESRIDHYVHSLAEFEQRLKAAEQRGDISSFEARSQYADEVRNILRAICVLEPEYAEDCFGIDAAPYYHLAAEFEAKGMRTEVLDILDRAKDHEHTVIFCGVAITPEKAKELGLEIDDLGNLVNDGKENWKFKTGTCRVKNCPSPKPTKVGPCSVCMNCQRLFDNHKDPSKIYTPQSSTQKSHKLAAKSL